MKQASLVSVVVACYNRESYLRSSILSLISEGIPDLEILVVDDASTDASVASLRDLPVRIISQPQRKGQAAAQNLGVRHATGKYLCFFDSDDILIRDGIRGRMQYLESNPTAKVVSGTIAGVINAEGVSLGDYGAVFNRRYPNLPQKIQRDFVAQGGEFPSQLWLYLFHREFLSQVGALDESLVCSHDNDYLHRVLKHAEIHTLPVPVAYYRVHDSNLSGALRADGWTPSRRSLAENLFIKLQYRI